MGDTEAAREGPWGLVAVAALALALLVATWVAYLRIWIGPDGPGP